jgi:hypothetical protein
MAVLKAWQVGRIPYGDPRIALKWLPTIARPDPILGRVVPHAVEAPGSKSLNWPEAPLQPRSSAAAGLSDRGLKRGTEEVINTSFRSLEPS